MLQMMYLGLFGLCGARRERANNIRKKFGENTILKRKVVKQYRAA